MRFSGQRADNDSALSNKLVNPLHSVAGCIAGEFTFKGIRPGQLKSNNKNVHPTGNEKARGEVISHSDGHSCFSQPIGVVEHRFCCRTAFRLPD
jgi:hypothetical protein